MTSHIDVATVRRNIILSVDPEDATQITQWFDDLPVSVKTKMRPHLLSELYGAMSAIGQHREYGSH